jgi:ribosomal protein S18 acetylase RimI-like enzyme
MIIRKAKKEDIEDIISLEKESLKYHEKFDKCFHTVSKKSLEIQKKYLTKDMRKPSRLILVAEIDKKVVGFIFGYIIKMDKHKIGKVQEIIVTAKYRKVGIGRKLMKKLLNFFRKNGCAIAETVTFVGNTPGEKFYESAGFKKRTYTLWLKFDKKFMPFA